MQREVDKITTNKNEEVFRLKDHGGKLLTQIKKLKNDKKSLKDKLEQLTQEVSKSLDVTVQVEEKGINTDPVNITTQGEDKLDEVKMYSEVAVPTTKYSSEDLEINHSTSITKGNQVLQIKQGNNTNKIMEIKSL